jgi:hypothetical protein
VTHYPLNTGEETWLSTTLSLEHMNLGMVVGRRWYVDAIVHNRKQDKGTSVQGELWQKRIGAIGEIGARLIIGATIPTNPKELIGTFMREADIGCRTAVRAMHIKHGQLLLTEKDNAERPGDDILLVYDNPAVSGFCVSLMGCSSIAPIRGQ